MYAKNIMTNVSDLKVIYSDMQIKEAVEIMLSNGLTELPVVDRSNIFLGEMSMRDILKEALPRYIADGNLKDVSFAPGLFKFDDKLKDIMYKEVSAVMEKSIRTVSPEMSTFEVATLLAVSEYKDDTVYVVEKDGRLAGAVLISSIFLRLIIK